VETVIHEVTHNTLFVSEHVKFNESLANFVGSVGAIEFFCGRGHDEGLCELARGRWHDNQRLSEFLDRLWSDLDALYAEGLARDELLPRREALLAEAAAGFQRDYVPAMHTRGFARFDASQLNNASLIARHLYYHRLPLFQAFYEEAGSLTQAIERIAAAVRGANEPWAALEGLVKKETGP
jgi:predicted aminopeptidase